MQTQFKIAFRDTSGETRFGNVEEASGDVEKVLKYIKDRRRDISNAFECVVKDVILVEVEGGSNGSSSIES